jgi:hypothetical protein
MTGRFDGFSSDIDACKCKFEGTCCTRDNSPQDFILIVDTM